MKMKVVDQLHLSALGPHTMGKNTEFEVSDDQAADLEKRGLAVRVGATKMAPSVLNKQVAPALNKQIIGAKAPAVKA